MIDQSAVLGRVGSVLGTDPYGGGGAGGSYVFADLAHLIAVTDRWRAELDKIQKRTTTISDAIALAQAPADDQMSRGQVEAFHAALLKLQEYNQALFEYAKRYVQKLEEAQAWYAANDEANRARMTKLRSET